MSIQEISRVVEEISLRKNNLCPRLNYGWKTTYLNDTLITINLLIMPVMNLKTKSVWGGFN